MKAEIIESILKIAIQKHKKIKPVHKIHLFKKIEGREIKEKHSRFSCWRAATPKFQLINRRSEV